MGRKKTRNKSALWQTWNNPKIAIPAIIFLAAIGSLIVYALTNMDYTATVFIYPEQSGTLQVVNYDTDLQTVPTTSQMPFTLYGSLLRTPQVQAELLQKDYNISFRYAKYRMNLMEYFLQDNVAFALSDLNTITDIEYAGDSSFMKISVTTRYPDLSRQLVHDYLRQLKNVLSEQQNEKIAEQLHQILRQRRYIGSDSLISKVGQDNYRAQLDRWEANLILAAEFPSRPFNGSSGGYTQKNMIRPQPFVIALPILLGVIAAAVYYNYVARPPRKPKRKTRKPGKKSMPTIKLTRGPEEVTAELPGRTTTRKTTRKSKVVK